jgi:hypothetical protein
MVKKVYIIRHCEKPKKGPCCSDKGYRRAEEWKEYFKNYNLTIYTAGFSTKASKCVSYLHYLPDKDCQHSQRMFLTAHIIGKDTRSNYCIGDEKELVKDVLKEPNDVLIVWQHNGIAKIMNYLKIPPHHINTKDYNNIIVGNFYEIQSHPYNYNGLLIVLGVFIVITITHFIHNCIKRFHRRRNYISIQT